MIRKKIVIVTIRRWNIINANKFKKIFNKKYDVIIITKKEELCIENLKKFLPDYIFFPHWQWIIPSDIYENFECIAFHITDLPYGRGGSPLQNLIINKVYNTKISAFKVEKGIDTGKIYIKENFYIGLGSAQEIFQRFSEIVFFKMIPYILEKNPVPYEQEGEVVTFKRRTPEESNITSSNIVNLDDIYDFIRMLDAEGYPKAFLKINNLKISFSEVHKKYNKLIGRFEIINE